MSQKATDASAGNKSCIRSSPSRSAPFFLSRPWRFPMTSSIWNVMGSRARYHSITQDVDIDVAIIGGGITGITSAMLLKEAGQRVAVIEASTVGGGVTSGTSAHLTEV